MTTFVMKREERLHFEGEVAAAGAAMRKSLDSIIVATGLTSAERSDAMATSLDQYFDHCDNLVADTIAVAKHTAGTKTPEPPARVEPVPVTKEAPLMTPTETTLALKNLGETTMEAIAKRLHRENPGMTYEAVYAKAFVNPEFRDAAAAALTVVPLGLVTPVQSSEIAKRAENTAHDEMLAKAHELQKSMPNLTIEQCYLRSHQNPANYEIAKRGAYARRQSMGLT
jgi:hypothetical protein